MIDIIKNINCDINKVTLPINFLININKQDIIDINLSFDNYTIENGYRKCFKTSTKYITNDVNIVFKEGYTN